MPGSPPLAVAFSTAAEGDLVARPLDRRAQVVADLEAFAASPTFEPPRVKQLRGFKPPLCRLRSGDYRVLFRIAGTQLNVSRVIDRKHLDRTLRRLK